MGVRAEQRDEQDRLPPGQQLVAPGKWPIIGERVDAGPLEPWIVSITGLVANPLSWTLEDLQSLGAVEQVVDIHCVTRWSKLAVRFRGIPLTALLDQASPSSEAKFVSFVAHSLRSHSTSLSLDDVRSLNVLLAWEADRQPISPEHGGPLRVIVPRRYFYKSLKWLRSIELLSADRLGYWESTAGYHNHANPLREERYVVTNLDKQLLRVILAERDLSGRDLLGLTLAGAELNGLQASNATLRDADFSNASLVGACFDGANLSNARFRGTALRAASFVGCDLEGADFTGADLGNANFSGAFLTAATFCTSSSSENGTFVQAMIDSQTVFDTAGLAALMPEQQEFVRSLLAAAKAARPL